MKTEEKIVEFKRGDIVKLKSGGPGMIVKAVDGDTVRCVFMAGTGQNEDSFEAWTLQHDRRDHGF
jgi:uncharacterized protein YodC (DUF2158 family)